MTDRGRTIWELLLAQNRPPKLAGPFKHHPRLTTKGDDEKMSVLETFSQNISKGLGLGLQG